MPELIFGQTIDVDSFYTVFIWLEAVRFLHKFTLIFGKIWSIEEGSAYSRDFS